jgi:uncharacterized protein
MFEYEQSVVDTLLTEDDGFRRLYDKHNELKQQIHEAHIGTLPLDDFTVEKMKKQKLLLKDQMAAIIKDYRSEHACV